MKTRGLLHILPFMLMAGLSGKGLLGETPSFRGMAIAGYNPIFIPQRKKLKGYQKENRRCSFGKNR